MAEKPILFSTPMVQAILDGRKTMTRRVCKDIAGYDFKWGLDREPYIGNYKVFTKTEPGKWDWVTLENQWLYDLQTAVDDSRTHLLKCPYKPGDRLWVRETWRIGAWDENSGCIAVDYKADGYARREWLDIDDPERFERYWTQSTHDAEKAGLKVDSDGQYHWEPGKAPTRWRPSIFMPKEAARIWLDVTDVRVERLSEITEEDAIAEGIRIGIGGMPYFSCREAFAALWNSLNAKRGFGWEQNPWVWVISFERIEL